MNILGFSCMTGQQLLHLLGDNVSDGYEPTVV